MTVMNPEAPISAADPMAPIYAPEHSPIADSSRLTGTWVKRSSCSMVLIRSISQLSGRLATSFTPHDASSSAMRAATVAVFSVTRRVLLRGFHRAPDGLGGDRQSDIAHAAMPKRVDHSVAYCRRRTDRPALAAALDAERIARRR